MNIDVDLLCSMPLELGRALINPRAYIWNYAQCRTHATKC